jgi:O-antigen biosynthesis protein WbqP
MAIAGSNVASGASLSGHCVALARKRGPTIVRPRVSRSRQRQSATITMKRAFDVVVALAGLAVLWPAMLAAMLAIRLESPGPAVFAQPRVGRGRRVFTCYKLRTMHKDTRQLPSHEVGTSALTALGGVLRRTKLDELPQLYNVLRGEMSLVGPRPCLPSQSELIEARAREGAFDVLPGITGLAQVKGVDMSEPLRLAAIDGQYARTQTFGGDLRLILQTLTGSGMGVDRTKG